MEYKDETLCVKVDTDKCHADLGDGRMTWENNGYFGIKRNNKEYVVLGRTSLGIKGEPTGNHQEVPYNELKKWINIYGVDGIVPMSELEEEVVEEEKLHQK